MIAKGLPASPGAAVGQVVFSADDAEVWHSQGKSVILVFTISLQFLNDIIIWMVQNIFHLIGLCARFPSKLCVICIHDLSFQVRTETSPEDIGGMHAASGILTARGGMTSHAAVVARGWGKCCVSGCGDIRVNDAEKVHLIKQYYIVIKADHIL